MDNPSKTSAEQGKGPATVEDLTGQTVAEFHILRLLGRGGMGAVYLAEQQSPKRKVDVRTFRSVRTIEDALAALFALEK